MKRISSLFFILSLLLLCGTAVFSQLPVVGTHPRVLIDSAAKADLLAKKNANDPDWVALQAEADDYAARDVLSWNPTNAGVWNTDFIFYNYCGSSWDDAAMALGMAHQITKGTATGSVPSAYSDKLLELVDTILSAYQAYPPCSGCPNILLYNSTYATRHVGNVLGVAFDWCYDELGPVRKAAMIAMFNDWFNYMRVPYNVYQNTVHPTGNYYFGHVLCAAYLGYASAGDNPLAIEMIDFARQRVLGTESGSLSPGDSTENWVKQVYTGGLPTSASDSYLGPHSYTSAPQSHGIPVQGWGYGGGSMKRLIDYCFMVKTATGEVIADSLRDYFDVTLRAFVHALTPNRFQIDNSNDWGSFVGNFLGYDLPLRLSAVSEGTAMGPMAAYVHTQWVQPVSIAAAWNDGYPTLNWENMLYADPSRPATALNEAPFYPTLSENVTMGPNIDKGMAKYYLREDWSDTATWCALNMSCAYYDDHDHHNAGHFQIVRGDNYDGDDLLLVGANEIGNQGSFGLNGIEGGTCYHFTSSLSNTLFFNDYHDYTEVNTNGYTVGGQSFYGTDEPTHQEQNLDFTYVRADLTSAYYRKGELADTVNRTLDYFYRSFLYLRDMDVVLSYDHFKAQNSNNVQGQYQKHLRWHFLAAPVVNGNNITATQDHSKLFIHTVLPAATTIQTVDETNNPDNTFGPGLNYAFNTYSWRAEVAQAGNPLAQTILSVLQPSSLGGSEMTTTAVASNPQDMEGSLITLNGGQELVLFNVSKVQRPVAISTTNYSFAWHPATMHTLVGVVPSSAYDVTYDGTTVTVNESGSGNVLSSPSGVLRFAVSLPNGVSGNVVSPVAEVEVFPNPSAGEFTCRWEGMTVASVEVSNVLGQVVGRYALGRGAAHEMQVRVEDAGVYYVRLCGGNGVSVVRRVVVMR